MKLSQPASRRRSAVVAVAAAPSPETARASYNEGPGEISRLWRAAGPGPGLDRPLEDRSVEESRDFVTRIRILAETYRSLYPDLG